MGAVYDSSFSYDTLYLTVDGELATSTGAVEGDSGRRESVEAADHEESED